MTPSIEHGTALKRYQRALLMEDTSYLQHRSRADLWDCETNQAHRPSTLELPYKNELLVRKSPPSDDGKGSSDDTRVNQRVDHIRAVKSRFLSRSRKSCGTCRKRKKKCDEARPTCGNCIWGDFECAGYTKEIPWSENNPSHAPPAPQSQQQLPSTEVLAHIDRCLVYNATHSPQSGPSQKAYAAPIAASRITTSRDGPFCIDGQGRKPL